MTRWCRQPAPAVLAGQLPVSQGVVADGVTPLLFKFDQNIAVHASYNVAVDNPGLSPRIHILNGGVWSDSPTITFDGTNRDRDLPIWKV